tara:strand:+ start:4396 stop:4896 length:501 start_codon:yes stop_codon:yes gene_type:complete
MLAKKIANKVGSLDNFFKWVKGTNLIELDSIDITEDPVRPELSLEFRKSYDRKIYGLEFNKEIEGIICVAFTNDIPKTVKELDLMSQNAHFKQNADTAVAYTVWSRKRGAGKEILQKTTEFVKGKEDIKRLVTLSPLTPMATHFHIRNKAKLISINPTTQNFEYRL